MLIFPMPLSGRSKDGSRRRVQMTGSESLLSCNVRVTFLLG